MRDHTLDTPELRAMLVDITKAVEEHVTKHPGSVQRSDKAKERAKARRAKASRKANR
jgi:hypothetical protein